MEVFGFVEGEHYLGYVPDCIDEMLDQIAWCNEHQAEAEQMAIRAWRFVLSKHTYFHRAQEVLA